MGSTLTICLPDELAAAIERISEDEQIDENTVIRRLLERVVHEYRHEQAFEQYQRGEISLGTLAEQADIPLRQVLAELRERGVPFQYSTESLYEDFPAL